MRMTRLLTLLVLGTWASTALAGPDRAAWLKAQRGKARQELQKLGGAKLTVQWPAHRSRPAVIRGLSVKVSGRGDVERARRFAEQRPALFAGAGSRLVHEKTLAAGDVRVVRFKQTFRGVPVEGVMLTVGLRRGRVTSINSDVEPISLRSGVTARVSRAAAVKVALGAAGARGLSLSVQPRLVILPGGTDRLVYKVMLPLSVNPAGRWHLVDAVTGEHLGYRRGIIMDGHQWRKGVRP